MQAALPAIISPPKSSLLNTVLMARVIATTPQLMRFATQLLSELPNDEKLKVRAVLNEVLKSSRTVR